MGQEYSGEAMVDTGMDIQSEEQGTFQEDAISIDHADESNPRELDDDDADGGRDLEKDSDEEDDESEAAERARVAKMQEKLLEKQQEKLENTRFPGDIVRDRKTGVKGKFINEYGTNGRAIIVIPEGMSRSELWDASTVEIIKKVKRPTQMPVAQPAVMMGLDGDDEDMGAEDEDVEE